MKKFIAIFVLAASLLSPGSCSDLFNPEEEKPDAPPATETGNTLEDFQDAIADNQPTKAVITVTDTTVLGVELKSNFEVTYKANGDATIVYSIERLLPIDENYDPDKIKETKTGTVNYTASSNSYSDGGVLVGSHINAIGITLELDEDYIDYEISGNTLTAEVLKADTEYVIGSSVSDLDMTITIANGKVSTVVMSYDLVKISCSYTY